MASTSGVPKKSKASFVADSLATGMLVMLAMTIIQRAVGFFRSIWLCRLMDDHEVGLWSLSYIFLIMVTPMVLLGLPGSMPRYVEHYRQRGHLAGFVRKIVFVSLCFCAAVISLMLCFSRQLAHLVYSDSGQTQLVYCLVLAAVAIIIFFIVVELVSSLRQVRVASLMYFLQGVLFTLIGISCLSLGGGIHGLVLSFGIATTIAMLPGIYFLAKGWKGIERADEPFNSKSMWAKLIPYAAAIWAMNLLTNAFDMADRAMILHMLPGDELVAQSAIGQYHSSRIFAVLLLSVATMIVGVLMPYLTADWEAGRKEQVKEKLRQTLLLMSTLATLGAATILLLAPWVFSNLLEGRYTEGLALMPMGFLMCTWSGLATLAQCYLLLTEKGKFVAWVFGICLIVNVAMNAMLLPMWGLFGAVVSTVTANGLVFAGILYCNSRHGYKLDTTSFYAFVLPATLLAGPTIAIACTAVAFAGSPQAKTWLAEGIHLLRQRLNIGGQPAPS